MSRIQSLFMLLASILLSSSSIVPYSWANDSGNLLAQATQPRPLPPQSVPSGVNVTAPNIGPSVDFEWQWRMQERFGVDLDGKRVVGRPVPIRNTRAYVFNVREGEQIPSRPEFIVELDARKGVVQHPILLRLANQGGEIQFSWTIKERPNTGEPIDRTLVAREPVTQLRLPEGHYRVMLNVQAPNFRGHSEQDVRVKDIVIVALGDSYSSGEGNPESSDTILINSLQEAVAIGLNGHPSVRSHMATNPFGNLGIIHRTVRWADDGLPDVPARPEPGTRHISFPQNYFQLHETRSRVGEEHIRAHRSSKSWPAMAALAIERADEHSSVTFIHLAASGATIRKGVLGPYKGTDGENLRGDPLQPQVDQMRDLVANRAIDVLTLSVGGNDVGFAFAVASLVALNAPGLGPRASRHPLTYSDIERGFRTGNWSATQHDIEFLGIKKLIDDAWDQNLAGTSFLLSEYARLSLKLMNSNIKTVWMTAYPNPLWRLNTNDTSELCDALLKMRLGYANYQVVPVEIDHHEISWANDHLARPLNELLLSLPRQLELTSLSDLSKRPIAWMVDGGIAGESERGGHGTCAERPPNYPAPGSENDSAPHAWRPASANAHGIYGEVPRGTRWFRTHHESLRIQGGEDLIDTKGTLHPNEYGHWAMARRMLSAVPLPVPISIPGIRESLQIGRD